MSETFAIAVEWPDDSRPYLVHLQKPYFVAAVRRTGDAVVFLATLNTEHVRSCGDAIADLLPAAHQFFMQALGMTNCAAHFVKGRHRHEFPRFLMARTNSGSMYIVEPDHPFPLVEVKEPAADPGTPPKLSARFDVVTQWRLAQMRKYYQQFAERQQQRQPATLVVPTL